MKNIKENNVKLESSFAVLPSIKPTSKELLDQFYKTGRYVDYIFSPSELRKIKTENENFIKTFLELSLDKKTA